MRIKERIKRLEIALSMIELFQEIQATKYSDDNIQIMKNKIVENKWTIPDTTYYDVVKDIKSWKEIPMHICLYHQEEFDLWQELADNYWE